MRIGDFVTTKSGKRWVLAHLTTPEAGSKCLLARTVKKRSVASEMIFHGCHASEVDFESSLEVDQSDAFLFGTKFMQFHKRPDSGLDSLLVSMCDEDGKFYAFYAWELSLVAMHGMEPPLYVRSGPRRLALPEEV